jgi:hypothetical protein
MAPKADTPITVRMETGTPNSGRITIHAEPGNADDLRRSFDELGLPTSDIIELSVPEVLETVFQVQNVLGSAGLVAVAKAFSIWLHRNDNKDVEVIVNDKKARFKGMGEAEITRIMSEVKRERDDQWRDQFPNRFPLGPDDEL